MYSKVATVGLLLEGENGMDVDNSYSKLEWTDFEARNMLLMCLLYLMCGPMALGHPGPAPHSRVGGNPFGI